MADEVDHAEKPDLRSLEGLARRACGMFGMDPEEHQLIDALDMVVAQLTAWRANSADVPEAWKPLLRKGWSVPADQPTPLVDTGLPGHSGPFRVGGSAATHGLTMYEDSARGVKTGELWGLATSPERAARMVNALNAIHAVMNSDLRDRIADAAWDELENRQRGRHVKAVHTSSDMAALADVVIGLIAPVLAGQEPAVEAPGGET